MLKNKIFLLKACAIFVISYNIKFLAWSKIGDPNPGPIEAKYLDWDRDLLIDTWEFDWGTSNANLNPPLGFPYNQFVTNGYRFENLIGWWQLDEEFGSEASNRGNSKKPLKIVMGGGNNDSFQWIPSPFSMEPYPLFLGSALDLNAVYLTFGGWNNIQELQAYNLTNFTFSVWFRIPKLFEGRNGLVQWKDANGNGWRLEVAAIGSMIATFQTPSGTTEIKKTPSKMIGDNRWHQVVLTYNKNGYRGTSACAKLYIDGELEAESAVAGSFKSMMGDFTVGKAQSWLWWGDIDEIRLYNCTLNAGEVRLLPNTYADPDQDGLVNVWEQYYKTNPLDADSDDDYLSDGQEIQLGLDALNAYGDKDQDGLLDNYEVQAGLDPNNKDSDGDGMNDGWEVKYGLNPKLNDAQEDLDGDGISNLKEYQQGSDPSDYYNGLLPQFSLLSVNPMKEPAGVTVQLQVQISKPNGESLTNAPVRVETTGVMGGGTQYGYLKMQINGVKLEPGIGQNMVWTNIRTDSKGIASIYYQMAEVVGQNNTINLSVKTGAGNLGHQITAISQGSIALDGLQLWLRGDMGVESDKGGNVKKWQDMSGNGRDATNNAVAQQPKVIETNQWLGRNLIKFDGQDDRLHYSLLQLTNLSIVMLYRAEEGMESGGGIINNTLGTETRFRASCYKTTFVTNSYLYAPKLLLQCKNPTNLNWKYISKQGKTRSLGGELGLESWSINADQGSSILRQQGQKIEVQDSTASWYPKELGTMIGYGNGYFKGDIAEVIVYNRALNENELQKIEQYLSKKYGLEDQDGDGLSAWQEAQLGTDPNNFDSNGDGISDGISFDYVYGIDPDGKLLIASLDPNNLDNDQDGLSNEQEIQMGTDPFYNDSDGDGIVDGQDAYPLDNSAWQASGEADAQPRVLYLSQPKGAIEIP